MILIWPSARREFVLKINQGDKGIEFIMSTRSKYLQKYFKQEK